MLALTELFLHQNLRSRIIPVSITILVKRPTKPSSAPKHQFPCLSNWDFTVTNISYVVPKFVRTCHLILTMRTPSRMSFFKRYFDHVFFRLLDQKRDVKRIYSSAFERCREQTARSHAYRNRFNLGHYLDVGQKVLHQNHQKELSKSQKLQQRRLGSFTVTKRVTSTKYQIQDDKDPSIIKVVHLNHLVYFYPKEESFPAMIEEYVPYDQ